MHNRAPGRAKVDSRVMTHRGGLCVGFRVFMIVQAVQVNYSFFNFAVCSATKDHCAGMLSDAHVGARVTLIAIRNNIIDILDKDR